MNDPWGKLRNLVLNTSVIRDIDRRAIEHFGMNSLVLMENAAGNCARWLVERFPSKPSTVILCGSGNNGGDGVVIARHLRCLGWPLNCFVLGPWERMSRDNQQNSRILLIEAGGGLQIVDGSQTDLVASAIAGAELIIDAMLGTAARGNPKQPLADWIEAANRSKASKIAIDIPTGIDADTGVSGTPCFHTDHTLTFVALKPSMTTADASTRYGKIEVLPIGICEAQIRELVEANSRNA